ncbi:MAG: MGMT family protein [Candidatus Levybacteria bacterium]|nr:MGMT family protein [Candidatus Levybacteria bacterium]
MTSFKEKVIAIVQSAPYGKVVSYGQVAAYLGMPRGARQVGWILNATENSPGLLPWWRVVNNVGYLSIRGTKYHDKKLQRKLLVSEGVKVSEDFLLPMSVYRYRPSIDELKKFQLGKEYVDFLITKYRL